MRIAVIGGGFTGLSAAYYLSKQGHSVTVFEKENHLGGLAGGFRPPAVGWDWPLEKSYHHLFTNDHAILGLINELGLSGKLIIKRPVTANLLPRLLTGNVGRFSQNDKRIAGPGKTAQIACPLITQLDSPVHLLRFPGLSMTDKLRTGALVAFCKVYPFWQTLEGVTAKDFFIKFGGSAGWEKIWAPMMNGKFGKYENTIAASWLWARIHKRTPSLCYITGGFAALIDALAGAIKINGGSIQTGVTVSAFSQKDSQFCIHNSQFNSVLFTTPTPVAVKLISQLPTTHYPLPATQPIPHLYAQTLILETDKPILRDVYWLSVNDRTFPFLAVVAHTNFMDKKHYGNRHLTYIGNYLPDSHPYLSMTKEQLLKLFLPYIKKLHPSPFTLHTSHLFTAPYAQPVHQLRYSLRAPKLVTPVKNVYLANIDSIYPWDRGTNYAVELGQKAAKHISERA
jgi:protoporphyrinogen oxidase